MVGSQSQCYLESRTLRMPGHPGEKVGVGRMQQIPEVVVQPAQDRHRYESAHHRNEIAHLAAARLGEHPHEENSQKRALGVPKDTEHDWNHPRMLRRLTPSCRHQHASYLARPAQT
jgi:hypothetical protein